MILLYCPLLGAFPVFSPLRFGSEPYFGKPLYSNSIAKQNQRKRGVKANLSFVADYLATVTG
jgi:hypothetical protein